MKITSYLQTHYPIYRSNFPSLCIPNLTQWFPNSPGFENLWQYVAGAATASGGVPEWYYRDCSAVETQRYLDIWGRGVRKPCGGYWSFTPKVSSDCKNSSLQPGGGGFHRVAVNL